ncbi:MAG: hypothetical protein N3A01_09355 [Bacteroidales bacterium]|nr:hypothetical protein [Bacteroidales bacterium]
MRTKCYLYAIIFILFVAILSCKKEKNEDEIKKPQVWHCQTNKKVIDIDIYNRKLYAAVENGIQVFDLTNPTNPVKIADTILSETPLLIKAGNDSVLYIATNNGVYSYKFKNNKITYIYKMLTSGWYEPYIKILIGYYNNNYTKLFVISRKKCYVMNVDNKLIPVLDDEVIFSDFEAIDAHIDMNGESAFIKVVEKNGGVRTIGYSYYQPVGWSVSSSCVNYCYAGNVISSWYQFSSTNEVTSIDEPFVYALGVEGIRYLYNNVNMVVKTKNKALGGYTSHNYIYVADSLGVHMFKISSNDNTIFAWTYIEMNGVTRKIVPLKFNTYENTHLYTASGNAGIYIIKKL